MVKPTLVVLGDGTTTLLDQTVLCKISSVLCYEDQYFTWILVLLGWVVSIGIAVWQYRKSTEENRRTQHNDLVKMLREKSTKLEEDAFRFWLSKSSDIENQIYLSVTPRELKEITRIAQDLKSVSDIEYPSNIFITLRRELTNDKLISEKPLAATHSKITNIANTFAKLNELYRYKS